MAEGIGVNSQSGDTEGSQGSGVANAIGFITEFNQNAAIFNQVIGEALSGVLLNNQSMRIAFQDIDWLRTKTQDNRSSINQLARELGLRTLGTADNPAFQNKDRTTADGTGFSE